MSLPSPLILACCQGSSRLVSKLIGLGADVNQAFGQPEQSPWQLDALRAAMIHVDYDVVKLMISAGAEARLPTANDVTLGHATGSRLL
jgi:ankyrin repeat protein